MNDSLVIIPIVFSLAYAVFGGIEFGLPLSGWVKGAKPYGQGYFVAIWESTNVLLVIAFTAVFTLYSPALPALSDQLQSLWLSIGGLLAVRGALILALYYGESQNSLIKRLLTVVSLLLPATLMQTLTILMTGDGNLLHHVWLASAMAAIGIAFCVALWSSFFAATTSRLARTATISFVITALICATLLPWALGHDTSVLAGHNLFAAGWQTLVGIAVGALAYLSRSRWRHFVAASVLTVLVGLNLAYLQIPYLMRPSLTLADAATNPATQLIIAIGFVIMVVVVVPSLFLLRNLAASSTSD